MGRNWSSARASPIFTHASMRRCSPGAVSASRTLARPSSCPIVSAAIRSRTPRLACMSERRYFAHESSYIDEGCQIGDGTKIWHFSHVMEGATIGAGCSLGQNVFVASAVIIGRNCKIQNNVSIYDNVTLDDDVFCGPSMVFTNVYNPRSHVPRKDEYRDTLVRRGATLGASYTIV